MPAPMQAEAAERWQASSPGAAGRKEGSSVKQLSTVDDSSSSTRSMPLPKMMLLPRTEEVRSSTGQPPALLVLPTMVRFQKEGSGASLQPSSQRAEAASSAVLPARMESRPSPPRAKMPPPIPAALASTRLLWRREYGPIQTPPPFSAAVLPRRVLSRRREPPASQAPPPERVAVLETMALKKHVFETGRYSMDQMLKAVAADWKDAEPMRLYIRNHTPFFGNDDKYADDIAVRVYDDLVKAIEGRPNTRGGKTQLNMLSTTCHNYFGQVCGASVNGRFAHFAISDGTSPAHGSDTKGPTCVVRSLGKLDQTKSGGTLLNVRFIPALLKTDAEVAKLGKLIREYFKLGGHHIQFNIVDTETLCDAQQHPDEYRDLLVRVAGYSDYFNDMTAQLQNEIIARTENDDL